MHKTDKAKRLHMTTIATVALDAWVSQRPYDRILRDARSVPKMVVTGHGKNRQKLRNR